MLSFIAKHPLASKNISNAYWRLICWQIQATLNKNLLTKSFIGETKFLAKKGLTGITGNIYTGLHEFEDMAFVIHFLRKEDTFYDIGANVGSYTLLASSHIGANTVAFEPIPTTFSILSKNIALNNSQNRVKLCNKAIGSKPTILKFTSAHDTVNHAITHEEEDKSTIQVPVDTLDSYPFTTTAMLKIDVEGFESEVLAGGHKCLSDEKLKAIIIELNGAGLRYGYKDDDIHAKLLSLNFKPYTYNPFQRSFEALHTYGTHNTLYIKDLDFVMQRCKTATKVTLMNVSF